MEDSQVLFSSLSSREQLYIQAFEPCFDTQLVSSLPDDLPLRIRGSVP